MRRRSWFTFVQWVLIVSAFLAITASGAEAQLVNYDDFSAVLLDESRWIGLQFDIGAGGTGVGLEIRREVRAGRLLLQTRAVGGSVSNSGLHFSENALLFRNPDPLTEIAFDVRVRELEITGCPAGPASFAAARGFYSLFNDGSGDVIATVEVRRSSASTALTNMLEVVAILIHRTVAGDSLLGFSPLGTAVLGQRVRLQTKWDQVNSMVEFQKDLDPAVAIAYTNTVISQPSVRTKFLGGLGLVSDCLTAPAPSARLLALFDNVQVNP